MEGPIYSNLSMDLLSTSQVSQPATPHGTQGQVLPPTVHHMAEVSQPTALHEVQVAQATTQIGLPATEIGHSTTTLETCELHPSTHSAPVRVSLKTESEEQVSGILDKGANLQVDLVDSQGEDDDTGGEDNGEESKREPSEEEILPRKRNKLSKTKAKKKGRAKRNLSMTDAQIASAFSLMRKRRQDLTLGAKVKVLEMLDQEPKVPQGKIASVFHVSQSQVSRIMKNKDTIMAQWNRFATPERKRCRLGKAGALEQKLADWYKEARKEDLPISGPILMEKAKSIGSEMGIEFKPSAGWLGRWKDRNGVTLKRFKDKDGAPSTTKVGNHWRRYMFTKATKEYSLENVWVLDETILMYSALPDCLAYQAPNSNERVTILLTCNLAGTERRPPLVVGKSEGLSSLTLPVLFHYHPKSVITLEIFSLWLKEWDRELRSKRKKIVLLMNKAPHHPDITNTFNIHVTFFPPDTSSVLQPLQLGIITAFKSLYRYQQIKFILAKTHANEHVNHSNTSLFHHSTLSVSSMNSCVSPLDAVYMIYKAWKHVSPETIVKGVVKAGLSKDVDALSVKDNVSAPPGVSQNEFEALVMVDDRHCVTEQGHSESQSDHALDIHIETVPNIHYSDYVYENPRSKTRQISQEVESTAISLPAQPSVAEVVYACQILREYLQQRGGQLFDEFSELESAVHLDMILENRPDLRSDLQPDPLHNCSSVHSLHAHNAALEQKLEYLQKVQEELQQQKVQKEVKKVTQTAASLHNSHTNLSLPPQEIRTDLLHNQDVGLQRSDAPCQEVLRQDITRQELQPPMQRPEVLRQSSVIRPEYQDRSRASLMDLRSLNMPSFRPLHADTRNDCTNDAKTDLLILGGDLRSLGNHDHRGGVELHHQGTEVNVNHNMRQPDARVDNHAVPYYTMSNSLHQYLQPK